MKKKKYLMLAVIPLLLVVLVLGVNASQLQGNAFKFKNTKLTTMPKCNIIFENFGPIPRTLANKSTKKILRFEWNGPGCSKYEWKNYEICFTNKNNRAEYACVGDIRTNNHKITAEQWKFIDSQLLTTNRKNPKRIDTEWYIQSVFGDAINGEIIKTQPWSFSYSK